MTNQPSLMYMGSKKNLTDKVKKELLIGAIGIKSSANNTIDIRLCNRIQHITEVEREV